MSDHIHNNILYGLALSFHQTLRETRAIKWIVDLAVLLTLLPLAYPRPDHPWIEILDQILYSNKFLFTILGAYSVVDLSFGIIKLLGRRTNPSLILSASFLLLILVGSLLLMMPKCTYGGIAYTDALFVSTSAVCITGLTPVDVYTNFTPMGVTILAALIQIGGLGVMTFTSFFAIFFSGNASIYSQMLLRDMIYSRSMSALVPTLFYILGFTLTVEAIGAVAIWLSVTGTLGMTLEEEMAFAHAYGELFKVRYADKLFFDTDIDPRYLKWTLPALSLQPLIGNAVKHNTITRKQPFHVSIRTEGGTLVVSNRKAPKLEPEPGMGIGLKNLRSRWQLITGEDIRIIETDDEFTVRLPLQKPIAE